jgi:hypothetical protein
LFIDASGSPVLGSSVPSPLELGSLLEPASLFVPPLVSVSGQLVGWQLPSTHASSAPHDAQPDAEQLGRQIAPMLSHSASFATFGVTHSNAPSSEHDAVDVQEREHTP